MSLDDQICPRMSRIDHGLGQFDQICGQYWGIRSIKIDSEELSYISTLARGLYDMVPYDMSPYYMGQILWAMWRGYYSSLPLSYLWDSKPRRQDWKIWKSHSKPTSSLRPWSTRTIQISHPKVSTSVILTSPLSMIKRQTATWESQAGTGFHARSQLMVVLAWTR